MKKTSCGILLQYYNKFLLVKSSGGNIWGVPKGVQEDGETFLQTALRELKEETGLGIYLPEDFNPAIQYSTPRKKFVVFRVAVVEKEFGKELFCETLLENGEPEVDAYAWVDQKSALVLTKRNHSRTIFENL